MNRWATNIIQLLLYFAVLLVCVKPLGVFVANLRKKLERDPARPSHFLTEPGVGYRFTSGGQQ